MDRKCLSQAGQVAYSKLPLFVLQQIGRGMSVMDRLNFMQTNQRVRRALKPTFSQFRVLQVSDDLHETFLAVEEHGAHFPFHVSRLKEVVRLCPRIEQVSIAVRAGPSKEPDNPNGCPIFDTTLYHRGGFVGRFVEWAPASLLLSMTSLALTVDLTTPQMRAVAQPLPFEDLQYALAHLTNRHFVTSIQIGICATEPPTVEDIPATIAMKENLRWIAWRMAQLGHKVHLDLEHIDGYTDVSVETDKVDFSFGFFYFNPNLCEPEDDEQTDQKPTT